VSPEAKVGLLVVFVAILAIATGFFMTDLLGNWGSWELRMQFTDVQGLEPGAQVRLGGVQIGRVVEVELKPHADFPAKPASVLTRILPDAKLYKSDTFEIKQGAVVGDKYVAVLRPEKDAGRTALEPGAVVSGAGASSTEVIMDETRALINSARAVVESIGAVANDEQAQNDIRETIANLNKATARSIIVADQAIELATALAHTGQMSEKRVGLIMENLVATAETVDRMARRVDTMLEITPVPAQLAMAGENLRQATEDVAAMVAETRQAADDAQVQEQLAEAVTNLRVASDNVRQATEDVTQLTGDEQMMTDIRDTLANVRGASESLRSAAAAAEELITDDQTDEDLRTSLSNLRDASESGRSAMARADDMMDNVERTLDSVRRTQSVFREVKVSPPVIQIRASADNGLRADVYTDINLSPDADHSWRVGLRDLGDADRVDLLWSQPAGTGQMLRAGIIGNRLGVVYEREFSSHGALEAQLYDPDELRLDLGVRWGMWRDYYLLLGVERVAEQNDPFAGVRYQQDF